MLPKRRRSNVNVTFQSEGTDITDTTDTDTICDQMNKQNNTMDWTTHPNPNPNPQPNPPGPPGPDIALMLPPPPKKKVCRLGQIAPK